MAITAHMITEDVALKDYFSGLPQNEGRLSFFWTIIHTESQPGFQSGDHIKAKFGSILVEYLNKYGITNSWACINQLHHALEPCSPSWPGLSPRESTLWMYISCAGSFCMFSLIGFWCGTWARMSKSFWWMQWTYLIWYNLLIVLLSISPLSLVAYKV